MNEKSKRKNMIYIIVFGVLLLAIIISVSYAYFGVDTTNNFGTKTISASIECIDIEYSETNIISLKSNNNNYPIKDEYALTLTPLTVTVTNNCSNNISYVLTFTSLRENTGYIPDSKMRTSIKRKLNTNAEATLIEPTYINSLEALTSGYTYTILMNDLANRDVTKNHTNKTNYVLDIYNIGSGETNTYKVYLWIDYYEGDSAVYTGSEHDSSYDNTTQNLNYKAALSLVLNSEEVASGGMTGLELMASHPDNLSTSLVGGLYRYQGTYDAVDNNYICFGTSDVSTCKNDTDHYMYRIIGINESGQIKVIKKEALNTGYKWHSSAPIPDWPNSDLFVGLNGDYYLNNKDYVPTGWKEKIAEVSWKYGKADVNIYNGDTYYSTYTEWSDTTNAKISLMYPHDYVYAYGIEAPESSSNAQNAWIYLAWNDDGSTYSTEVPPAKNEWLNTPASSGSFRALYVNYSGIVGSYNVSGYGFAVRPVLYLESVVTISGDGTISDPYIITN